MANLHSHISRFMYPLVPIGSYPVSYSGANMSLFTLLFHNFESAAGESALDLKKEGRAANKCGDYGDGVGMCAVGNCRLLEINTLSYPNVHVECSGLWDKDASLRMVEPPDGRDWGWITEEVREGTQGSFRAVSVQSLLHKYNFPNFEYIKLDIEGSEWQLFRRDDSLAWLKGVKLMSLEVSCTCNSPTSV